MFREIILPIFRSTRLCYSLWYNAPTMLPTRCSSMLFIYCKYTLTCFRCPKYASSGVHKTVTAASDTGHSIWATSKVVAQILWLVPEAAVTVLCTPDDGCDGHLEHVEYICSKQIPAYCCILLELINTVRTGLLNCLNARSRGLTFRHRASCI